VPPSSDIAEVGAILDQGVRDSVWIFQEGYFAHGLNSPEHKPA